MTFPASRRHCGPKAKQSTMRAGAGGMDCFVAALLANVRDSPPSLRAQGEAIQMTGESGGMDCFVAVLLAMTFVAPRRHCEPKAKQSR